MRTSFFNALCELATSDPRIWLVVGDLGFSVAETFAEKFPDRFINAGVAEQNMTGIAAGLALCGKIVFTYSIANFPSFRCLEQIRNDVCFHQCNVKIVSVGGGFTYGPQGYSHHGIEDLAILRALPGLTILAPGDPIEAYLATKAIVAHDGPCYLRLGKAGEPVVHKSVPAFFLGKAVLVKPGNDLTLISIGGILKATVEAADQLERNGVSVRVLSMPTLKPVDEDAILRAARETRAIITLEEHTVTGGLGDAVASVLACRAQTRVPFSKVGIPDAPGCRVGSHEYLMDFLAAVPDIAYRLLERGGPNV